MSSTNIYEEFRNSRDFTGKVVLVTGSSGGIGEQIVKLFASLGANVVITGRREAEVRRIGKEAQELSPKKLKPLEIPADIGKDEDLHRVFNEIIKTFKRLDVVVNNAGSYHSANPIDKDFADIVDKSMRVDVGSALKLIHLSAPYLKQSKGQVVNISSVYVDRPQQKYLAYQIAKQALEMATKGLAVELAPYGVRVNSISIGIVQSYPDEIFGASELALFAKTAKQTPLGRVGRPIDVAKAVVFLTSSDSDYITGHNLVLDGGLMYNMGSDFTNT